MKSRKYIKSDYEKIMNFLNEMYQEDNIQRCWLPTRWEYAEFFVSPLYNEDGDPLWYGSIQVWEDEGKIVGIAHVEDPYNAFIQLRKEYVHLEKELIEWIETNLGIKEDGKTKIKIWSNDNNKNRNQLLEGMGYQKSEDCSYWNRIKLTDKIGINLPDGYEIKSLEDDITYYEKFECFVKAFHPNEEVDKELPPSVIKLTEANLYQAKLDIVVQHKGETVCSVGTVWYDPINNYGMIEPVGTHASHQRKGLGKAIISECINRMVDIGAEYVYVESYGDKRYAFYSSVGFRLFDKDYYWTKEI